MTPLRLPGLVQTQQPQGVVQIDWNNPLTKGLVFCVPGTPGNYNDIVGGKKALITGSLGRTVNVNGVFPLFNGSQYLDYPAFGPELPVGGPATIAFIDQAIAPTGYGCTIDFLPYGASLEVVIYQGSGGYNFVVGPRNGGAPEFSTSITPPTDGVNRRMLVRCSTNLGSSATADWNVFYGQSKFTTSSTTALSGGGASLNRWGAFSTGGDQWEGALGQMAIWNRALSDAEAKSYNANPWQLFKSATRSLPASLLVAPGRRTALIPGIVPTQPPQVSAQVAAPWRGKLNSLYLASGSTFKEITGRFPQALSGTASAAASKMGMSCKFNGTSDALSVPNGALSVGTKFSKFSVLTVPASPGTISSSGNNGGVAFTMDATYLYVILTNGGTMFFKTHGYPAGTLVTVGAIYDGANITGYVNGANIGVGGAMGNLAFGEVSGQPSFGQVYGGSNFLSGLLLAHADFGYSVGDAVAKSITANFWQLVQAPQRELFLPPAVPGRLMSVPGPAQTQQPQGVVRIDPYFAKMFRLGGLVASAASRSAVIGTYYDQGTLTKVVTPYGYAERHDDGVTLQKVIGVSKLTEPYFCLFVFSANSAPISVSNIFVADHSSNANAITVSTNASGSLLIRVHTILIATVPVAKWAALNSLAITVSATEVSYYLNGIGATITQATAISWFGDNTSVNGQYFYTYGPKVFLIGSGHVYDPISAQSLSANPWQLFKSASRQMPMPIPVPSRLAMIPGMVQTQQPQGAVQADRSPKFGTALLLSFAGVDRVVVGSSPITRQGSSYQQVVTRSGLGVSQAVGSNYWVTDNKCLPTGNVWAMALTFKMNTTGQTNRYLVCDRHSGTGEQTAIIYGFVANTVEFFASSYTGSDFRPYSAITVSDTLVHTIVYSYDGTTFRGFIDGKLVFETAISFSLNLRTNAYIGAAADGAANVSDATFFQFARFSGPLTLDTAKSVSANPWQLFKAPQRELFLSAVISPIAFVPVSGPYSASQYETTLAGDSCSAVVIYAGSVVENVSAFDVQTAIWSTTASMLESATASDVQSNGGAATSAGVSETVGSTDAGLASGISLAVVTESGVAGDGQTSTALTVAAGTETTSATDSEGAYAVTVSVQAETSTATESPGAINVTGAFSVETTSASEGNSAVSGNGSVITEGTVAGDSTGASAAMVAAQTESALASHSNVAVASMTALQSESHAATTAEGTQAGTSAATTETTASGDAQSNSLQANAIAVETSVSSEAIAAIAAMGVQQSETHQATDVGSYTGQGSVVIAESSSAADSQAGSTEGGSAVSEISASSDSSSSTSSAVAGVQESSTPSDVQSAAATVVAVITEGVVAGHFDLSGQSYTAARVESSEATDAVTPLYLIVTAASVIETTLATATLGTYLMVGSRMYHIQPENRTMDIAPEDRTLNIGPDNTTLNITP